MPDGRSLPLSRRQLLASGAGALIASASPVLAACTNDEGVRSSDSDTASGAPGPAPTSEGRPSISDPAAVEYETPFITPADRYFRIDTASDVPNVSAADWSLRVHGLVDRAVTLSLSDLSAFEPAERMITLACVSNEVGGKLVGNATWRGVLLADVLRAVSVQSAAEQVFTTSADGWTCGFPVAAALDDRGALIATEMNGAPLAPEHGYPARLVVPGLYGYVSATKWLSDIELTTWDASHGFWTTRGWSVEAPIKPQSRIDVPRRSVGLDAGPIALGGVAWAPRSGVAKVQVRVDDSPWSDAQLDTRGTGDTWRQWYLIWEAEPGEHRVAVRVITADGEVQTDEKSPPDPNGATGLHTRRFTIR